MSHPDTRADAPTAQPAQLKDRAFALACQGMRSPTIALELGIPERTARAWIQQIRTEAAEDRKAEHRTDLALAIERQLAISTAAWQGYERAARAEQHLIARLELTELDDDPHHLTRFTAVGARYLTVAQSAQREAARLQDLYGAPEPEEPQQLLFLVINAPPAHPDDLTPADREAWDAFKAWRRTHRPDDLAPFTYSPQPTFTVPTLAEDASPSAPPFLPQREGGVPHWGLGQGVRDPETENPAETADIRDLPGVATYPPDLTNPAPVTPALRRHLTDRSEVLYMPVQAQPDTRRNERRTRPTRTPRRGTSPPRR